MILENKNFKINVQPLGAELRGIYDKKLGKELMWSGNPNWWGRVSPVLFPIVGDMHNQKYSYKNKSYSMPSHGFLRDSPFQLESQTEKSLWFVFESNKETLRMYPFNFKVRIGYYLDQSTVKVMWHVLSTDDKEMLFSIGAHPAFLAQPQDTISFVSRGKSKRYILDEKGTQEGYLEPIETLHIEGSLFKNDAIIYDNMDALTLHTKDRNLHISFKNFEYVGIWSKYVDKVMAPFVCIEPWMGIDDFEGSDGSLENKLGIQKLKAHEEVRYEYSITID